MADSNAPPCSHISAMNRKRVCGKCGQCVACPKGADNKCENNRHKSKSYISFLLFFAWFSFLFACVSFGAESVTDAEVTKGFTVVRICNDPGKHRGKRICSKCRYCKSCTFVSSSIPDCEDCRPVDHDTSSSGKKRTYSGREHNSNVRALFFTLLCYFILNIGMLRESVTSSTGEERRVPGLRVHWKSADVSESSKDKEEKYLPRRSDYAEIMKDRVCSIIDKYSSEIPVDGFDPITDNADDDFEDSDHPSTNSRNTQRAATIMNAIVRQAAEGLCSKDPTCMINLVRSNDNVLLQGQLKESRKVINNIALLAVTGSQTVSPIANSLLASSLTQQRVRDVLAAQHEGGYDGVVSSVGVSKYKMGSDKFSSSRANFEDYLKKGKDIPPRSYSFRVPMSKIVSVLDFFEGSLQVIPGASRSVKMYGEVFPHLPVYERGGRSKDDLFVAYKKCYPENRVGQKFFVGLLDLLSKQAELKAGLSSYLIELRYIATILKHILDRIPHLELRDGVTNADDESSIQRTCKQIQQKWEELYVFLSFEFGAKHISKNDPIDAAHCCTFAVGGNCTHTHNLSELQCSQCISCFDFFHCEVEPFFKKLRECTAYVSPLHRLYS